MGLLISIVYVVCVMDLFSSVRLNSLWTHISALSILFLGVISVDMEMPLAKISGPDLFPTKPIVCCHIDIVCILRQSFEFIRSHNGRFQVTQGINNMVRP